MDGWYIQDEYIVKSQKYYYPGQTTPFRTVNYSEESTIPRKVTVENGVNRKLYTFAQNDHDNFNSDLTQKEETFKLSGELLKRVTYSYTYFDHHFRSCPDWVQTEMAKADGAIGPPALYQYEYDELE